MLFGKKSGKQLKIVSFLFRDCSNGCSFCFQKQYSGIPSLSDFMSTPPSEISGRISDVIAQHSAEYENVSVGFMGGELFEYPEVGNRLADIILGIAHKAPNARFKVATNLLYPGISSLTRLIESVKGCVNMAVCTSYDFGNARFNAAGKFETFKRNVRDAIAVARRNDMQFIVEAVRTKHMLRSYLAEDEQFAFFKWLTENSSVCQNELIGEYQFRLTPEESEKLWMLCISKTPRCSDLVSQFLDRGRSCAEIRRATVIGGSVTYGCAFQKYGEAVDDKPNDIMRCVRLYGCETCEYADVCSVKCPIERCYSRCDKKAVFKLCRDTGIRIGGLVV